MNEAVAFFDVVMNRLLNVNSWHEMTAENLAEFQLFDVYGKPICCAAREGLLIRVDILGPGSADGYDWVKIEEIKKTRI